MNLMESNMYEIVKMKKEQLCQVEEISKEEFQNTTWSNKQFEKEIENSFVCIFETKIVGFLCLQLAGDDMTILNIAVSNNFKRKKIATRFLQQAKEIAKENNIINIFLEVETNNIPALSFYKKNGFKVLRTRNNYYKDGTSCVEMKLNLLKNSQF